MTFECKDLDRALAVPELMPDALRHAKTCDFCRRELQLWNAISETAPTLHQEWDSPELWPKIRLALQTEQAARKRNPAPSATRRLWAWGLAAAAVVVAAVLLNFSRDPRQSAPELLTEQALRDVQSAEAAYVQSIEKLSRAAQPVLEKQTSDFFAIYREKLLLIDTAIADLKTQAETNRFNAHLQVQLSSLYREKQHTLEEILDRDRKN